MLKMQKIPHPLLLIGWDDHLYTLPCLHLDFEDEALIKKRRAC